MFSGQSQRIKDSIEDFLSSDVRISLREKANFFRIVTTLLLAGIPIVKSMEIAGEKVTNERLAGIITFMQEHISQGDSLSWCMKNFPFVFSETETGLIEAGEKTGTVDTSLERISKDLEKYIELRSKVISSLLYPCIILALLAVVIVIVVVFVVPTLAEIFVSQGVALPFALSLIQDIGYFSTHYGLFVLLFLAIGLLLAKKYYAKRAVKYEVHYFFMKVPIYGDILRKSNLIMLAQTLATMLSAGLPLIKSLDLLIKTQSLIPYQDAFSSVRDQVTNGGSLAKSIPEDTLLFPKDFSELLIIGESSASLEEMLQKIAVQYNFELEYKLRNLTTVLEPIALIVVAVFIGIFAFTVLGSIFDLMSSFSL